jgi:hypothetical protein
VALAKVSRAEGEPALVEWAMGEVSNLKKITVDIVRGNSAFSCL